MGFSIINRAYLIHVTFLCLLDLQGKAQTFTKISGARGLNTGNNKDGGAVWADFDGQYSYSNIAGVYYAPQEHIAEVFPNPFQDHFNSRYTGMTEGDLLITLLNMQGKDRHKDCLCQ